MGLLESTTEHHHPNAEKRCDKGAEEKRECSQPEGMIAARSVQQWAASDHDCRIERGQHYTQRQSKDEAPVQEGDVLDRSQDDTGKIEHRSSFPR
jgi:hypothetical protein